jgi:hypothetical protein
MAENNLDATIQYNCDVSDAHGGRGYSLCTLFLRLRGYYRWEKGLEPWEVPDSAALLAWIADKETYWLTLEGKKYAPFIYDTSTYDPFEIQPINMHLVAADKVYGAGYGRSLKPIFFLAEKLTEQQVNGCRIIILGHETHRELAAPFAMLQEELIYLRREPFRYYLWDQINDIRPSGKGCLQYALRCYKLLRSNGLVDRDALIEQFDALVENEMPLFIYHEVGELKDTTLGADMLKKIVAAFAESPIELLARAIKDILADTHPEGMLHHIIAEKKKSSLGFYLTFLDGLRKVLFPEIQDAFLQFMDCNDWRIIERATNIGRLRNIERATTLLEICGQFDIVSPSAVRQQIEQKLLAPLGLLK